ncbi:cytochrome c oxidase subunit CcoM [Marinobacter vulgaris]|uniref:cytochrome c oxidase subunit CcoM n=1 Tax=Marinobacter vulgaris TaxID=1928331 RepID=UPI0013143431
MYTDAVVIAGIVTVLLMVGFFIGVGVFVMKDAKHQLGDHGRDSESPEHDSRGQKQSG